MENDQIIDEASEWFVNLREPEVDAATQARFMDWLRRSPQHVEAYLNTVALWEDIPALGRHPDTMPAALIAQARAAGNIVPLHGATSAAKPLAAGAPRRRGLPLAIAASTAVLLAGLTALLLWSGSHTLDYETGIGEQRSVRLSDGSSVELNSLSRIRVRYSAHERAIELVSGQALFEVAKDPQRTFLVSSDAVRVRALGTRFDVNRRKAGTVVTVVDGRVAVSDDARHAADGAAPPGQMPAAAVTESELLLLAGQQVTVRRAQGTTRRPALSATPANTTAVTAWTRGELVYRSEPLSAVIDEFNRYNAQRIVIDDAVEDFPITATFASKDSNALLKFLAAQPDLRIEPAGAEVRVLRTAAAAKK